MMKVRTCLNNDFELSSCVFEDMVTRIKQSIFRLARRLPFVQRQIAQARHDTLSSVYADMTKSVQGHLFTKSLPEHGLSKVRSLSTMININKYVQDELMTKLKNYRDFETINYESGKVSGCVYKVAKPDMTDLYHRVSETYSIEFIYNSLVLSIVHQDVRSIRRNQSTSCRCFSRYSNDGSRSCAMRRKHVSWRR
jgi:hypothetical protein